mmetsp:Transcript_91670/g.233174  ORF Transcript_91670/g.233174 Transcript_91670/m.233174 type:complete len:89 (-) Transcript_91670:140-406(-)
MVSAEPFMGLTSRMSRLRSVFVHGFQQAENPTLLQQAPQEHKAEGVEQSTEQPQAEQLPRKGEHVAEEVLLETEEGAVQSVVCCGYCS